MNECNMCRSIDLLARQADTYGFRLFELITTGATICWAMFVLLWLIWQLKRIMLDMENKPTFQSLGISALYLAAISLALGGASTGAGNYIFTGFLTPIQNGSVGIATALIHEVSGITIPTATTSGDSLSSGSIAALFGVMENSMMHAVITAEHLMVTPAISFSAPLVGSVQIPDLAGVALGLLLLLPIAIVCALFAAFLCESVFTWLVITCLAGPLLMASFFRVTRPAMTNALRLFLCAGLTVILLAVALGFTYTAITGSINELKCVATYNPGSPECNAVITASNSNSIMPYVTRSPQDRSSWSAGVDLASTPQYWSILFLSVISILLHVKAKVLASLLTGANDGPGPVGAVIAGVKAAALMGPQAIVAGAKIGGGILKGGWSALFKNR